jgi:hypothetical protein
VEAARLTRTLKLAREDQITAWSFGAKEFMTQHLDVARLAKELFPYEEEELFREVAVELPHVDAREPSMP